MAIFSPRQSTHLFQMLVYAGADSMISHKNNGSLLGFILRVPYIFRKNYVVCISFVGKGEFVCIIIFFHGPSVSSI